VGFTIAAAWFEPMRNIELWMHGVKLKEEYSGWDNAWFDFTHSFAGGTHQANIFAAGYDNALQHTVSRFLRDW
jgi:hypothetical protein